MSTPCLAVTHNRAMGRWHHWVQLHEEVLEQVSALDMIIYGLSCPGERLHLPSLVEDNFSNRVDLSTLSDVPPLNTCKLCMSCVGRLIQGKKYWFVDCLHEDVYCVLGKYLLLVIIHQISRRGVLRIFNNFGLHTFSEFHHLHGASFFICNDALWFFSQSLFKQYFRW